MNDEILIAMRNIAETLRIIPGYIDLDETSRLDIIDLILRKVI